MKFGRTIPFIGLISDTEAKDFNFEKNTTGSVTCDQPDSAKAVFFKKGNSILFANMNDKAQKLADSKFVVSEDSPANGLKLTLPNVDLDDEGIYLCTTED